jgi:hypothetical protein
MDFRQQERFQGDRLPRALARGWAVAGRLGGLPQESAQVTGVERW